MKKIEVLIIFICIILFSIISYSIYKYNILSIDISIYKYISTYIISDTLTKLVIIITNLGGVLVMSLLGVICFIFCKVNRWFITFDLIGCTVINQVVKHIVARPRPDVLRLVEESGYSFPSGHTMISIAFYGLVIYLIYKNINNKYLKYILIILLSLLIILIGFSRIYVGVHYFSDVMGGLLLGLVFLIVYINIYKRVVNDEK